MSILPPLVCETTAMSPLNLEVSFDRRELIGEMNEWISSQLKASAHRIDHLCINVIGKIYQLDGKEEEYHQDSQFRIKDKEFRISASGPFLASLARLISGSKGFSLHFMADLYTLEKDVFKSQLWVVGHSPS